MFVGYHDVQGLKLVVRGGFVLHPTRSGSLAPRAYQRSLFLGPRVA